MRAHLGLDGEKAGLEGEYQRWYHWCGVVCVEWYEIFCEVCSMVCFGVEGVAWCGVCCVFDVVWKV